MSDEILLTGFDEFNRMLNSLKTEIRKSLRRAFRVALRPVQKDAKQNSKVASGEQRDSIKIRAGKFSRKRIVTRVTTGDRTSKGRFHSQFQHWGWKPGKRPDNQSNEPVPGDDFLKKAAEDNESQIERILIREVGHDLEAQAKAAL